MSVIPGAPDVLALVKFAYQVYDTFQSAPSYLKGLSEDINGLRIVLKRLANRLALKDTDSKAQLGSEESTDLEQLVNQTARLLKELKERPGAGNALRGLRRFSPSQLQILDKLDDILITIQQGSKDAKSVMTLAEDDDAETLLKSQDEMWQNVVQELQTHGIPEEDAWRHRTMIHKWAAKAAAAGILGEEPPLSSSTTVGLRLKSEALTEEVEVLSAVYGPLIVTEHVQRIFQSHLRHSLREVSFVVANQTFGGDPFINWYKAFSMVWRKITHSEYGTVYTAPQKMFALEGDIVRIDLDTQLPVHETHDDEPASIQVLIASWHNRDVTEHVAKAVRLLPRPYIMASNHEFGEDVCLGNMKVLSVTWSYSDTASAIAFCETKTAKEGQLLELPPPLLLIHANLDGRDVTTYFRTRVTADQTLHIDDHSFARFAIHGSSTSPVSTPTSESHHRKSLSILYRYGNDPLQLLVTGESVSDLPVTIAPTDNPRRGPFFFASCNGPAANVIILAAIWGLQPVSEITFLRALLDNSPIQCTNEFFGTDGWSGVEKTCQIFLQNTLTGEVTCVVEREGNTLTLPIS